MKGGRFQKHFIIFLTILCVGYLNALSNKSKLKCKLSKKLSAQIDAYKVIVKEIQDMATNGSVHGTVYDELKKFVNQFSTRISGSEGLERSIDYMLKRTEELEFDNVHGEEVMVPHWVRGKESLKLLKPENKDLPMLGLGFSIGTPRNGITAKAIVVKSFEDLQTHAEEIPGCIVVFNQEFVDYGTTVKYRTDGATEAAKLGAKAVLIRSITPSPENIPHTGMMVYDGNVTKIPAACIGVADAVYLNQLYDEGKEIKIKLKMDAKTLPDVKSRNVIAEITGDKMPNNVVVVSGHIDNWDVGQGAMDDAGGLFISWGALVLLKKLGIKLRAKPRRTIRAIFWTAEEVGLIGSLDYIDKHKESEKDLQFVMESDSGTFRPLGLEVSGTNLIKCIIQKILSLFKPEENYEVANAESGPDIDAWTNNGVPGATLWNANEKYYWYHHTKNDTIDVENSDDLDKGAALFAAVAYVLADIDYDLPHEKTVTRKKKN